MRATICTRAAAATSNPAYYYYGWQAMSDTRDTDTSGEPRKSLVGWLCGMLMCCSCSRRTEKRSFERSRSMGAQCVPRHVLRSPATLSLLCDACFLVSLVLVLYYASIVMRDRDFNLWWLIPTAFAAPTCLVIMLKLRYLRRLCDVHWQDDVVWNARIILLPMLGALVNTALFSCWVLCAPLYVVELATLQATDTPMSIEDYAAVVRQATFDLFSQPSSIALFVTYAASVIVAVYLSARHRRVLIRFVVQMGEDGVAIAGSRSADTSLLRRDETGKRIRPSGGAAPAGPDSSMPVTPFTVDTASIDSLYATGDFVHEQASFIAVATPQANNEIAMVADTRTGSGAQFTTATTTVGGTQATTPRPPGVRSFDTIPKKIADEAASRRAETLSRYDSARSHAAVAAAVHTPIYAPLPSVTPPATASGADDESETRIDSPRTIERVRRQKSKSSSRTAKDD
jgi:hypothetical protein